MAELNAADWNAEEESLGTLSAINITPFVDVVLVLLIIFMVTAPMLIKEVMDLRLPKTSTSDGQATETLGIAVNRDGNILVNGVLADEASLRTSVQAALQRNADIQAIIAADKEVAYGRVVKVIDILKSSGLNRFAVQIERENNN